MKKVINVISRAIFILCVCYYSPISVFAQSRSIMVNLAMLDGVELTPKNVFNFSVVNNGKETREVTITGNIVFRKSNLSATYHFDAKLYPGNNQFSINTIHNPQWTFSNTAFKELFTNYGKLPQGTYEYCVNVALQKINTENLNDDPINDCIYQTVNDIFLINLIDPEDNAKIYEHNPLLSWIVNYPFANELTYRIRVVELKKGQNNVSAITRNNSYFQDSRVMSTSLIYPATAKPLQTYQPYVWTVDAYYKGILLGGAEPWRFTIVEDSIYQPINNSQSYYEFEKHIAETRINAVGEMKLKYHSDKKSDTMNVQIYNEKGKVITLSDNKIAISNGDNMIKIILFEKAKLKHNGMYNMHIQIDRKKFDVPFIYLNPLYIKQ